MIEKLLEALTVAVEANTAVQEKILAKIEKAGGGEGDEPPARSSRRGRDAEEEAPRRRSRAAEDDDKGDDPPRRSRRDAQEEEPPARSSRRGKDAEEEETAPRAKRGAAKDKAPKFADVRAALADLLETKDKDEEEDRRAWVEKMLKVLDCKKASDIDEKDFADVLRWVDLRANDKFKKFD